MQPCGQTEQFGGCYKVGGGNQKILGGEIPQTIFFQTNNTGDQLYEICINAHSYCLLTVLVHNESSHAQY